ncbi:MAG: VanW family protein [Clostridia bacterium]|nr:VanW family protein [Clostridia bacterium]
MSSFENDENQEEKNEKEEIILEENESQNEKIDENFTQNDANLHNSGKQGQTDGTSDFEGQNLGGKKKKRHKKQKYTEKESLEDLSAKNDEKNESQNEESKEESNFDENEPENVTKVDVKESKKEAKKKTDLVEMPKSEVLIQEEQNAKSYKMINVTLIVILIIVFSFLYAFINMASNKMLRGISIENIDVSNLSFEEAKVKISEAVDLKLANESVLYLNGGENEFEEKVLPSQINATYNIDEILAKAYKLGRSPNILVNNYTIITTALFKKNYDLTFSYNESALDSIVQDIDSKIPGRMVEYNYSIDEDELTISKGKSGIIVDVDSLKNKILDEIKSRDLTKILETGNSEIARIEIPVNEAEPQKIDLDKIYSEIYKEPVNAYYEKQPFKIYPEENGIDFAITLAEAKDLLKENKDEYVIPLKVIVPEVTMDQIGDEAFPDQLSQASTRYDASNRNRSRNLEIAAGKIDGKVLLPGEEFSFNGVVGKRTVEEGYRDAKIYSNGQVVDGLAGGICQISSTLYNAALLANLEITQRRNHYFKTSYIAAGRDATVVWGSIDFKFKNSRKYPIKIKASVHSGVAEFKIFGIKEEKEYEISILPVITSTIPYSTQVIDDPTLAPGQTVVQQGGMNGYRVTTYLEKKYNGQVESKEVITSDTYKAMTKIIRRGP